LIYAPLAGVSPVLHGAALTTISVVPDAAGAALSLANSLSDNRRQPSNCADVAEMVDTTTNTSTPEIVTV
jgi:hypothetical protein